MRSRNGYRNLDNNYVIRLPRVSNRAPGPRPPLVLRPVHVAGNRFSDVVDGEKKDVSLTITWLVAGGIGSWEKSPFSWPVSKPIQVKLGTEPCINETLEYFLIFGESGSKE